MPRPEPGHERSHDADGAFDAALKPDPEPDLELDLSGAIAEDSEPVDPEPRREQQRAEAERRADEHQQRDTGRHGEDRSRPSAFTRKMH